MNSIWVFNGNNSHFPSGVFSSQEKAEESIAKHKLSGILTEYPMDMLVYEWATTNEYFKPKRDDQRTPKFMQTFTSAVQKHFHYEDGERKT
jgi:hypothetical protein